MVACIRERYIDLIYGMQAWYKRVIRKVQHNIPEFKNSWSFEGYVGPLPKQAETSNTSTTWFHIAALFASVPILFSEREISSHVSFFVIGK